MPLVEVVEDRILDFGAAVIGLDATIVPGVEIQLYEFGRVRITNKRLGKRVFLDPVFRTCKLVMVPDKCNII